MKKLIFLVCIILLNPNYSFSSTTLPIIADINGLIITEIEINKNKFKVLLDTGGGAFFISEEISKNSSIFKRAKDKDQNISSMLSKQKADAFNFSFNINDLSFNNELAFTQNTKKFTIKNDGIDCCDAVFGIDFFKKTTPITIDRNKKIITLNANLSLQEAPQNTINFSLLNEKVIATKCESTTGANFTARVDTGSEAPLILQPQFTSKNQIKDRILDFKKEELQKNKNKVTQLDSIGNMPIISLNETSCDGMKKPIKLNAIVLGQDFPQGALTHSFVDSNLGSQFLGKKYTFDFTNKKIFLYSDAITTEKETLKSLSGKINVVTPSINFTKTIKKN